MEAPCRAVLLLCQGRSPIPASPGATNLGKQIRCSHKNARLFECLICHVAGVSHSRLRRSGTELIVAGQFGDNPEVHFCVREADSTA